jgi:hypothetical protein
MFFLRATKWLVMLGIFIGLGWWSYQSGLDLARAEVTALERRLETLGNETRALHMTNARLEGELRQARVDYTALQRRYERDVPQGEAAAMFRLAQERIGAGVPRGRIEQVLRDAGPVQRCDGRGSSRRFAVSYGQRVPENAGIEIHDGLIRVVVSAPNQTDDLTRAATVVIQAAGTEPQSFTGLPQRQTVVLGNAEVAVSVTSEIRGFATVATSGC